MYAPHTVTIYNIVRETDLSTLKEVEHVYITILRGVMLQASKAPMCVRAALKEPMRQICIFRLQWKP